MCSSESDRERKREKTSSKSNSHTTIPSLFLHSVRILGSFDKYSFQFNLVQNIEEVCLLSSNSVVLSSFFFFVHDIAHAVIEE